MNDNSFVACGGTGAHVMMAMVRLHVLGCPFGFFVGKKFPDLYLVDKDYNQSAADVGERTAWGEVEELVGNHPGRYKPIDFFGFQRLPDCRIMTPLPLGPNGKWSEPPNNTLENRFPYSDILQLITSQDQRKIKYNLGMMASPAVGSLLFSLKRYDTKGDEDYIEFLENFTEGNVVVCGSIVGGTGASVAPTLALRLEKANVMAVLIHRWFKFSTRDESLENKEKAENRNKEMVENAAGGLAYSGRKLAEKVATVAVGGVPVSREYTGDNQQSYKDSYVHVVGALAALRHFLSDEKIKKGLYGVSASNPSRLTDEIRIGEGEHSTLKDLVGQATCLVHVLESYCSELAEYERRSGLLRRLINKINVGFLDTLRQEACKWVYDAVDQKVPKIEDVARELTKIKNDYDELLKWLRGLDVEYNMSPKDKDSLEVRYNLLRQTKGEKFPVLQGEPHTQLKEKTGIRVSKEKYIALSLFHWIATRIKIWWKDEKGETTGDDQANKSGYWPPTTVSIPEGAIKWKSPGILGKVDEPNRVLQDCFSLKDVSSNGWPHPIAVAEEFNFKIEERDETAIRKLELLLLGRALNLLRLEKLNIEENENGEKSVSIEELIKNEYSDFAQYRLLHQSTSKVYGFNSPKTLLCPTPDTSDQDWQDLWEEINYHTVAGNWETSQKWGAYAREARGCIAAWVGRLEGGILENNCVKCLVINFPAKERGAATFGIAEWLPMHLDGKEENGKEEIPLPVRNNFYVSSTEFTKAEKSYDDPNDKRIRDQIKGFDEYGGFRFIKDLRVPDSNHHKQSMMWRGHLDKLQAERKIFAWWRNEENNQIWIMKKFHEEVIHVKHLKVIDLETILIERCIPLIQRPVPGSDTKKDDLKFPDLPLQPEYISLAKASQDKDETLVDTDWLEMPERTYELDKKNKKVRWSLYLKGYPDPVTTDWIHYDRIEPAEAHWMIWPNFRAEDKEDSQQWKAYYIYEHSARKLEARPILDRGDRKLSEPKKRPTNSLGPSRAVEFDAKEGMHTGGPPVALCAYDHERGEYIGLYKICLFPRSKSATSEWKIAVDFGTSHTAAAVKTDRRSAPVTVTYETELDNLPSTEKLSLHISENWPKDSSEKSEMQLDLWRPTYREVEQSETDQNKNAILPSDIWSLENIDSVIRTKIEDYWEPMTHYVIPLMNLRRKDSSEHTISGFKWQMTEPHFADKEPWLRKRYLGMAIEIFVASVIRDERKLPRKIQFTFTYPLRWIDSRQKIKDFKDIVNAVLKHGEEDLGFRVSKGTDEPLYSESHAAADSAGQGKNYEVKLVADLGGGTLDILISTRDKKGKNRFKKQVADSVQVGADSLLQIMAADIKTFLPESWWHKSPRICLADLRAWMRSEGSYTLFNRKSLGWKADGLDLQGFEDEKLAHDSRQLIDRYFQLIVDFLARSLVAYVAKDVWRNKLIEEEEHKKVKLIVSLRGNGWRLWYESEKYDEIQKEIGKEVENRAEDLWVRAGELWAKIDGNENPLLFQLEKYEWHKAITQKHKDTVRFDPKIAPIIEAVGKSQDTGSIDVYKFPLSRVRLEGPKPRDDWREWVQPLPFTVDDSTNTRLQMDEFDPPITMHSSEKSIRIINDDLMKIINDYLREQEPDKSGLHAPVAAIIWETVLRSPQFLED